MGYKVLGKTEEIMQGYGPRKGLEGPFAFANGQVLYYDKFEGKYWNPKSDFYLEQDEADALHQQTLNLLK